MKPELLHILQHSLGVDQYGRGQMYRNRFVTGPGSDDFSKCQELVDLELMRDHGAHTLFGGDHFFDVTDEGKIAMHMNSPEPPKQTRSQKRYQQFLKADSGLGFSEWIKLKRHEGAA